MSGVLGFVEIDLVGHQSGNALGEHAYTLTVTDIASGWTENRSVRTNARKWVIGALEDIEKWMPFPLLGIDSDNGSEFINGHLLAWCEDRKLTFTRSRPGNSNDGAHVEQKNWAVGAHRVGYHRYDTPAELALLKRSGRFSRLLTNYFQPQQKLISKVRDGAKVIKKYDIATTPHRRAHAHSAVSDATRAARADTYADINRAAVQRQIQALTIELLTLTSNKAGPAPKAAAGTGPTRAPSHESTNQTTRASVSESTNHTKRTS